MCAVFRYPAMCFTLVQSSNSGPGKRPDSHLLALRVAWYSVQAPDYGDLENLQNYMSYSLNS